MEATAERRCTVMIGDERCAGTIKDGGFNCCEFHYQKIFRDHMKKTTTVDIDGKGVKGSMFKLKLPVELVPPLFIRMVALVLLFGARKYAKNNWMKGMNWSEIIAGTIRHIYAFMEGKEYDEESGLPHLAHAACGLMFLIWFAYGPNRNKYVEFDDRAYQWNDVEGKAINDPWEKEVERINNINFEKIAVKEAK